MIESSADQFDYNGISFEDLMFLVGLSYETLSDIYYKKIILTKLQLLRTLAKQFLCPPNVNAEERLKYLRDHYNIELPIQGLSAADKIENYLKAINKSIDTLLKDDLATADIINEQYDPIYSNIKTWEVALFAAKSEELESNIRLEELATPCRELVDAFRKKFSDTNGSLFNFRYQAFESTRNNIIRQFLNIFPKIKDQAESLKAFKLDKLNRWPHAIMQADLSSCSQNLTILAKCLEKLWELGEATFTEFLHNFLYSQSQDTINIIEFNEYTLPLIQMGPVKSIRLLCRALLQQIGLVEKESRKNVIADVIIALLKRKNGWYEEVVDDFFNSPNNQERKQFMMLWLKRAKTHNPTYFPSVLGEWASVMTEGIERDKKPRKFIAESCKKEFKCWSNEVSKLLGVNYSLEVALNCLRGDILKVVNKIGIEPLLSSMSQDTTAGNKLPFYSVIAIAYEQGYDLCYLKHYFLELKEYVGILNRQENSWKEVFNECLKELVKEKHIAESLIENTSLNAENSTHHLLKEIAELLEIPNPRKLQEACEAFCKRLIANSSGFNRFFYTTVSDPIKSLLPQRPLNVDPSAHFSKYAAEIFHRVILIIGEQLKNYYNDAQGLETAMQYVVMYAEKIANGDEKKFIEYITPILDIRGIKKIKLLPKPLRGCVQAVLNKLADKEGAIGKDDPIGVAQSAAISRAKIIVRTNSKLLLSRHRQQTVESSQVTQVISEAIVSQAAAGAGQLPLADDFVDICNIVDQLPDEMFTPFVKVPEVDERLVYAVQILLAQADANKTGVIACNWEGYDPAFNEIFATLKEISSGAGAIADKLSRLIESPSFIDKKSEITLLLVRALVLNMPVDSEVGCNGLLALAGALNARELFSLLFPKNQDGSFNSVQQFFSFQQRHDFFQAIKSKQDNIACSYIEGLWSIGKKADNTDLIISTAGVVGGVNLNEFLGKESTDFNDTQVEKFAEQLKALLACKGATCENLATLFSYVLATHTQTVGVANFVAKALAKNKTNLVRVFLYIVRECSSAFDMADLVYALSEEKIKRFKPLYEEVFGVPFVTLQKSFSEIILDDMSLIGQRYNTMYFDEAKLQSDIQLFVDTIKNHCEQEMAGFTENKSARFDCKRYRDLLAIINNVYGTKTNHGATTDWIKGFRPLLSAINVWSNIYLGAAFNKKMNKLINNVGKSTKDRLENLGLRADTPALKLGFIAQAEGSNVTMAQSTENELRQVLQMVTNTEINLPSFKLEELKLKDGADVGNALEVIAKFNDPKPVLLRSEIETPPLDDDRESLTGVSTEIQQNGNGSIEELKRIASIVEQIQSYAVEGQRCCKELDSGTVDVFEKLKQAHEFMKLANDTLAKVRKDIRHVEALEAVILPKLSPPLFSALDMATQSFDQTNLKLRIIGQNAVEKIADHIEVQFKIVDDACTHVGKELPNSEDSLEQHAKTIHQINVVTRKLVEDALVYAKYVPIPPQLMDRIKSSGASIKQSAEQAARQLAIVKNEAIAKKAYETALSTSSWSCALMSALGWRFVKLLEAGYYGESDCISYISRQIPHGVIEMEQYEKLSCEAAANAKVAADIAGTKQALIYQRKAENCAKEAAELTLSFKIKNNAGLVKFAEQAAKIAEERKNQVALELQRSFSQVNLPPQQRFEHVIGYLMQARIHAESISKVIEVVKNNSKLKDEVLLGELEVIERLAAEYVTAATALLPPEAVGIKILNVKDYNYKRPPKVEEPIDSDPDFSDVEEDTNSPDNPPQEVFEEAPKEVFSALPGVELDPSFDSESESGEEIHVQPNTNSSPADLDDLNGLQIIVRANEASIRRRQRRARVIGLTLGVGLVEALTFGFVALGATMGLSLLALPVAALFAVVGGPLLAVAVSRKYYQKMRRDAEEHFKKRIKIKNIERIFDLNDGSEPSDYLRRAAGTINQSTAKRVVTGMLENHKKFDGGIMRVAHIGQLFVNKFITKLYMRLTSYNGGRQISILPPFTKFAGAVSGLVKEAYKATEYTIKERQYIVMHLLKKSVQKIACDAYLPKQQHFRAEGKIEALSELLYEVMSTLAAHADIKYAVHIVHDAFNQSFKRYGSGKSIFSGLRKGDTLLGLLTNADYKVGRSSNVFEKVCQNIVKNLFKQYKQGASVKGCVSSLLMIHAIGDKQAQKIVINALIDYTENLIDDTHNKNALYKKLAALVYELTYQSSFSGKQQKELGVAVLKIFRSRQPHAQLSWIKAERQQFRNAVEDTIKRELRLNCDRAEDVLTLERTMETVHDVWNSANPGGIAARIKDKLSFWKSDDASADDGERRPLLEQQQPPPPNEFGHGPIYSGGSPDGRLVQNNDDDYDYEPRR